MNAVIKKTEQEFLEKFRDDKKKARQEVIAKYGEKKGAILFENVMAGYGNRGNKRVNGYFAAKKWLKEQGLYEDIKYRALNGLPSAPISLPDGSIFDPSTIDLSKFPKLEKLPPVILPYGEVMA